MRVADAIATIPSLTSFRYCLASATSMNPNVTCLINQQQKLFTIKCSQSLLVGESGHRTCFFKHCLALSALNKLHRTCLTQWQVFGECRYWDCKTLSIRRLLSNATAKTQQTSLDHMWWPVWMSLPILFGKSIANALLGSRRIHTGPVINSQGRVIKGSRHIFILRRS